MNQYTTIGYFEKSPEQPLPHYVEAASPVEALFKAEKLALEETTDEGLFINTFIFEGHCKLLSSWAG